MKKPNLTSDKITGFVLFALGVAQLVLSDKKEKHNRKVMKEEIKAELVEDFIKQ